MGNRLDARLDSCRNSIREKNGAGAVRSFSKLIKTTSAKKYARQTKNGHHPGPAQGQALTPSRNTVLKPQNRGGSASPSAQLFPYSNV